MSKHSIVIGVLLIGSLLSCTTDENETEQDIVFRDLNATAGYNHPFPLDIDQDGESDFVFNTSLFSEGVGDHLHFAIVSRFSNQVLKKGENVEMLSSGDLISRANAFDKYYEPLVVRSTTENGVSWSGLWKDAQSKYIGIRFQMNGAYHYGWICISFSQTHEQIIIHKLAYRTSINRGLTAACSIHR